MTLFKKRLWHRCFPVNFAKFLKNPSGRLLLNIQRLGLIKKFVYQNFSCLIALLIMCLFSFCYPLENIRKPLTFFMFSGKIKWINQYSKAATRGVLWKNFAIFTRNHLCWSLFLIKIRTPTKVFSCEYCENFKNTYSEGHTGKVGPVIRDPHLWTLHLAGTHRRNPEPETLTLDPGPGTRDPRPYMWGPFMQKLVHWFAWTGFYMIGTSVMKELINCMC